MRENTREEQTSINIVMSCIISIPEDPTLNQFIVEAFHFMSLFRVYFLDMRREDNVFSPRTPKLRIFMQDSSLSFYLVQRISLPWPSF